jgi:hypothetical protein
MHGNGFCNLLCTLLGCTQQFALGSVADARGQRGGVSLVALCCTPGAAHVLSTRSSLSGFMWTGSAGEEKRGGRHRLALGPCNGGRERDGGGRRWDGSEMAW